MKKQFFHTFLHVTAFLLLTDPIHASAPGFPEPSDITEYMAPVPHVQELPQDEILYGDANSDGLINVLDIIAMINFIMGGSPECWFIENLNVFNKINSTWGGYIKTDNGIIENYCYNNDDDNCEIYGGLYEWPEGMQYVTTEGAQGICPAGWHIPADYELKILEGTVDSQYPVGDPELFCW